jgi:ABC-2 type transport system ATP-binding protein
VRPAHTMGLTPTADPGAALPALELRGVHKYFGQVPAVRGVDVTIRRGEVVAYLGPNGAGKTSTIDLVLGLSKPSSGQIRVCGCTPQQAVRRGLVSAVMQNGGLLKDLTVGETLRYIAGLFPTHRPIGDVVERSGLSSLQARLVGKCSGGEQQRLRFAMALLPDPQLLILDEPTQGMDVEGRRDFWAAIREDVAGGRTVLFATHYLEEADAYADRIVMLRAGEVMADGTPAEIKAMASGRTLRATLPGARAEGLARLPGVDDVEIRGESVIIRARDADAVARYLLNETAARDLEVTSHDLEQAFLTLTASRASSPERARAEQMYRADEDQP